MKPYRRILAVIDLDPRGLQLARHAKAMAAAHDARLGLGHVMDWGVEVGCDDFSLLTPHEVEERLAVVVRRRLAAIAARIGEPGASVAVASKGFDRGLADLARGWQPDLVVAAAGHDHGLAGHDRLVVPGWTCDVLVVELPPSGPLAAATGLIAEWLLPGKAASRT